MKSFIKTTVKIISLSIILFSIAFGVYAQYNYENILSDNTYTAKHKNQVRTTSQSSMKLADLYSYEDEMKIEEWMFEIKILKDKFLEDRQIEKWMLDDNFWKMENTIEQEPIEEDMEVEEWMKTFEICISPERVSGFVEKDWMKHHSFYIL